MVVISIGSLFAGIGGIELGLEMTGGFKIKWQVEIDPYAQKVLRLRFPEAILFEDVKKVGSHNLEKVDLICGGFPCQDISYAGKGVGIEGERSGLWSEFSRIIREIRPRYVLVENVAALLNRGMSRVLGDLASCGYDAEWGVLPAFWFGPPHERERLFVIAYTNGTRLERGKQWTESRLFKIDKLPAPSQRGWKDQLPTPSICRGIDGISHRMDRLKCLGNAVVPQIAFWIGKQILKAEANL